MAKEQLSKNASRTIYRDGDKVLKEFAEGFPKDEVFHEAFVNARIEEIYGSAVPKVCSVSCNKGKWTITKEYVEGETLEELMKKNPSKKNDYLKRFVELQIQVQAYKAPVLEQLKSKMQRQINELNGIDEGTRYELLTRLEGMPKHEKLCHGDFRPSNIIVDKEGDLHIIDWVHATKGNASADVARTYLILALSDKATADKYLDLFCEKTGTKKEYVQGWMPVVAAAQLTKKRPEEEKELRTWLQIVDHM